VVANTRYRSVLRAFAALVGAAWLAFAVHALLGVGEGPLWDGWLYNGLMGSAAAACLLRSALVREERRAWALLGAGIALWTAGEVYWSLFLTGLDQVPVPSPADILYLALYPASFVALVWLARARLGHFGSRLALDALIAALTVAALATAVAFGPILGSLDGSGLAVATNLAYPLCDVALLALVVGMTALSGWRPGNAWLMLAAGLGLMAVADVTYLLQSAEGTYKEGAALDLLWPTAALIVGLAAWQRPEPRGARRVDRRVTDAPVLCALVAVATSVLASAAHLGITGQALAAAALLAVTARMAVAAQDNRRLVAKSRRDALSDALTGLGNRRRLMSDLVRTVEIAEQDSPWMLAFFDLNGFKGYNDVFGHPAGDQLLVRLGKRLERAVAPVGRAYRLGGDEFCVLARVDPTRNDATLRAGVAALTERGDGFSVDAAHGSVLIPTDVRDATAALRQADTRMYQQKGQSRPSAPSQTCRALVAALSERDPRLEAHGNVVAALASKVAARLNMTAEDRDEVHRAAELHDLGKVAVPDAILEKTGPLDDEEWEFMRRHTLVGERILSAAPALAPVARLVRSSHEHMDGEGYPDGLKGEEIPLGARIVAVCDAFEAMTVPRPYRKAVSREEALAELRRCAGTQFDSAVVEAFAFVLRAEPARSEAPTPA